MLKSKLVSSIKLKPSPIHMVISSTTPATSQPFHEKEATIQNEKDLLKWALSAFPPEKTQPKMMHRKSKSLSSICKPSSQNLMKTKKSSKKMLSKKSSESLSDTNDIAIDYYTPNDDVDWWSE